MRHILSILFLVVSGLAYAARPAEPVTAVADLRYGTSLYHYYQGSYFDALVELMIAEERGGIAGHGDRPRIMQGSFSLAYGLERRANILFREVLNSNTDPGARDAAWFYLAKIRYLGGNWSGAAEALAEVSTDPPEKFVNEIRSLRINLAIHQNEIDSANDLLKRASPSGDWLPYVHYNLGAAASRAGNFTAAISHYNRIAEMPLRSDEHRALYDKAMTAAGYSYLISRQFPEAQAQFSRVRLSSPMSSSAMLGYGWAAAEQGDFLEALTPWQNLAEQSLVDENTQEALLAVPFAFEQLGNPGLALTHFEQAEQRFQVELAIIADMIDGLQGSSILGALRVEQGDQSFNWLDAAAAKQVNPQLVYLSELFSRNSFQAQAQELRDLLVLQDRMSDWRKKLSLYSGMLDEREAGRGERVNFLRQQELAEQIADMQVKRDELAQRVARVQTERDYQALVAGREADLHERVQAVADNIERLSEAEKDVADYRESHRRYAGILLWKASEAFADRLWEARRELTALDAQLQALSATHSRVAQAVNNAEDLQPYRQRLATSGARLERQLDTIDIAVAEAQAKLRRQIMVVLQEQRERLTYYLAQSRLAVARLYDGEWVEQ